MCSHSITLRSTTKYLSTMNNKDIKVDTEEDDVVEEDLDEA